MKAYKVSGQFYMKDRWQPFAKEVAALKPEEAVERIYSDIGSKHRVKRRNIKIKNVKGLKPDEVESPIIRHHVGAAKKEG